MMKADERKTRALGLCSGGLDSILSGLVLRSQGIEVEWISFTTPFFSAQKAKRASRATGIPLTVRNITPIYMEMLKAPRCGYGAHMNPCLDCHALMFKLAGETMKEKGFDLLFSGEVLGQRPMSQTRPSLRYVEKHSGFEGYILRPLSALKLSETIPEQNGLVDRDRLLDFSGRTRKPQIALAEQFGISDYPAPAGGCLLTDKGFSIRLRDLLKHQDTQTENELHLLKYGRHLRLDPDTKIIVGRTQKENERIINHFDPKTDFLLKVKGVPGPTMVMPGGGPEDIIRLAASVCIRYSKAPDGSEAEVAISTPKGKDSMTTTGIEPEEANRFLITDLSTAK